MEVTRSEADHSDLIEQLDGVNHTREPTVWLMCTGNSGIGPEGCLARKRVALRFVKVSNSSETAVEDVARELGRDGKRTNPMMTARYLHQFTQDVASGDVVVAARLKPREVWFGRITGAYEYGAPTKNSDLPHPRNVRWWGKLFRDDDFDDSRRRQIDQRRA